MFQDQPLPSGLATMETLNEAGPSQEGLGLGDIDKDMTAARNTLKEKIGQYAGRVGEAPSHGASPNFRIA